MKPEYHIAEAMFTNNFYEPRKSLLGQNVDNPKCVIGGTIITSMVVSHEGNRVETENSIYIVDSWYVDPET